MKANRTAIHTANSEPPAAHPDGSKTRVLLSSVFGPYAQDDQYGSRVMNPMELYHNQVTRTQGPFSLRMFHRSWGLMLIQSNIKAPCTVLDFPELERFVEEIREHEYDVVGITAIVPNILKVRKMCELVRQYLPNATIVVGGHVANMPDLDCRIDADHIVRGEGVRWFQHFVGEDAARPIRHPLITSGLKTRSAGIDVKESVGGTAATVIPSVGCPMGCNFCSTSAMFGGKGKFVNFFEDGDQLFDVMCQIEREMQVEVFFMMDENFLLHRKRALRLLELMKEHNKSWALDVFSSANVLRSYSIEELVGLGVSWVWMGIEGQSSQYSKLNGTDTFELIRDLQSHGIRVLGSTIIGLENHTPENIDEAIDYAVRHDTDFHQFMLYTPIPGTPLHAELTTQGRMKDESEYEQADIHGQAFFNYRHSHIHDGQESQFIINAFDRDFAVNGPSTVRIARSTLAGWKRYKNDPDPRIRRRYELDCEDLGTTFTALVSGARLYYRDNPVMFAKMSDLLKDLIAEFGIKARIASAIGGRWVLRKLRQEAKRLEEGWTREPPTIYERNEAVTDNPQATLAIAVTPRVATSAEQGPSAPHRQTLPVQSAKV